MRFPIASLALLLFPAAAGLPACGGGAEGSAHWVGKTYQLEVPPTHWFKPPGIGGDVGEFVPQFLIHVGAGTAGNVTLDVGTARMDVQDTCNPTTQTSASGTGYPDVEFAAAAFPLRLIDKMAGIVVNTTIHDFSLKNVLPGDAEAKEGGLVGTVDIAEIYPLFTKIPNATKDSVCAQLLSFGAPCGTCAFNGQPYCLGLEAVQLGAVAVPTAVTTVSAADVPASCATP